MDTCIMHPTVMPATTDKRNSSSLSTFQVNRFRKKIYDHFAKHGRDLPWRKIRDPYAILVSEIMLQQTQVDRVIGKYAEFLAAFPDFSTLAKAPNAKLLRVWQGMGYNRRALSLRKLARVVIAEHKDRLPPDPDILVTLPGIGKYTAGAVSAFAFNKPVIFMDTNIRRVFIHEFFRDRQHIHDDELVPLVRRTLDTKNPRKWYNALMDYGTALKKEHGNPNKRSVHYTRQSPFENSNRQVRGRIIKALVTGAPLTEARIVTETGMAAERVSKNLDQLAREGFIVKKEDRYLIE
jgi:A/G-specific adenine glycosylase